MFLKIQEPQKTLNIAVGIDLGTTHSLVAVVQNQTVKVLEDTTGPLLPSVVHYPVEGLPSVGLDALDHLKSDPPNTIRSVKRMMGKSCEEITAKSANEVVAYNSQVAFKTQAGIKTAVEISSDILKVLKKRAEAQLNVSVDKTVITVPAYFDDAQRTATKQAAQLAGFDVLRLINEPTAAAMAYGLDQQTEGLCLVFDLGGGTFDVTLLEIQAGVFQVKATGGDTALGGDDFDDLILAWFLEGLDTTLTDWDALKWQAKTVKEELSAQASVVFSFNGIEKTLTRDIFNRLIEPLFNRMQQTVQTVLSDARVNHESLSHVILVGGATRVPYLQHKLSAYLNKPLLCSLDPDLVVAMGAARMAALLSGQQTQKALLLDVIPLSLSIEMMGGVVDKILPKNTPIPAIARQTFTTHQDNQTGMVFHVVQGERELASLNRSLATFTLKNLPIMPKGQVKVEVVFEVSEEGLLKVSATELSTQVTASMDVKPSYGLTDEDILNILKEGYLHAEQDMQLRQLHQKRIEASELLYSIEKALNADSALIDTVERSIIEDTMEALNSTLTQDDGAKIQSAIEDLEKCSDAFMRQRMNHILNGLVRGRSLEQISETLCQK